MSESQKEHAFGVLSVLFAATVWGTTGTAATFAPEVSSTAIGAAAMGVGGLMQATVARKKILKSLQSLKSHWRFLISGAIAVAVYPLAFYGSMRLSGVAIGTVVTIGTAPLFSAMIEYFFDDAKLSKRWFWGASIGVLGMIALCLTKGKLPEAAHANDGALVGIFLGLIGGLTYAYYSWSARRLMLKGIPSSASMGATFGIGGLLLLPVLLATGAPFLDSWTNAGVGIYMAFVPMFLGYFCFGLGLARITASLATTITLLEPVVAAVLAVLVVGEFLPAIGWAGIALILLSLVVVTLPFEMLLPRESTASKAECAF